MITEDVGIFKAITAKMKYLDRRQRVISENVANADTPGFQAKDLKEVDFGSVLKEATGSTAVRAAATHKGHISAAEATFRPEKMNIRHPYEVEPSGNTVVIEEQMVKSSQINMDYNLMTSVYQKTMGMMRIAIGAGQR